MHSRTHWRSHWRRPHRPAAATGTGRAQTIAHLRVSEKEILGACLAELTGEEPLGKID